MGKTIEIRIDSKIYNDVKAYCDLNGLKIGEFVNSLIREGLTIEKYGFKPGDKSDFSLKENETKPVKDEKPISVPVQEKKKETEEKNTPAQIAETKPVITKRRLK